MGAAAAGEGEQQHGEEEEERERVGCAPLGQRRLHLVFFPLAFRLHVALSCVSHRCSAGIVYIGAHRGQTNKTSFTCMAFLFLQIGGDATFWISGTLYVGVIIGGCECRTLRMRHM